MVKNLYKKLRYEHIPYPQMSRVHKAVHRIRSWVSWRIDSVARFIYPYWEPTEPDDTEDHWWEMTFTFRATEKDYDDIFERISDEYVCKHETDHPLEKCKRDFSASGKCVDKEFAEAEADGLA